jgi:hypothetical protein
VPQAEPIFQQNAAADVSAPVKEADYLVTVTVPLAEVTSSVVLKEKVANMHLTKVISTTLVSVVTPVAPNPTVQPVPPVESAKPAPVMEAKQESDKAIEMGGLPTLVPGDMARKMEEVLPAITPSSPSGKFS